MKKITFLCCFLFGITTILNSQHLTTEEEYRILNPQSTPVLVQNDLNVDDLLVRLNNLGHQINGVEEFFSQDEILALRNHFSSQNRDVMGGPCDQAIEITSGNIVNQPLICGPGDLLNSGNVSPFCIDDNTGSEIPGFYGGGIEATYTYTPGSNGPVTITVDNTTWVAIFVYDGCPASGGVCVAATRSTTNTRTVNFSAVAGTEYFIWIDSWPAPASPCTEGGQMTLSGPEPIGGGGGGTGVPTAFGINNAAPSYGFFEITNPSLFTGLSAGSGTANFEGAGAIDPNDNDTAYVIDNVGAMWSVDVQTGVYTSLGNVGVNDMTGLEFNPVDGNLYGTTTTAFYSIDIGAVSATLIGNMNLPGGALAIALAIDGAGNAYTYDIVDDLLYSINTATGAATSIGPIGFDANFGQGMSWDAETDQIYMAAFNGSLFDSELRLVNTATGNTTSLGTIIPGTLSQIGWVSIINSGTGGGGSGNLWQVNVQDTGWGDEVTWELRDNLGAVILSGGPYGLGYDITVSVSTENEPLEFYIEAMGAFNDNTPTYTVSCGGEVIVTGSLSGGDDVTHSGLECAGGGPTNNWECADAIALECGDVVTGTTAGATNSGGNASPDVFYSYTGSGTPEFVTISLCDGGTTYDSFLRVYESCSDLSTGAAIAFNDDFCGLQSQLTFESDGTTTYIIMVEGFGTSAGDYSLAITCEPNLPPACGGIFTDSGGASGNYNNNEDITWTITPDDPDDYVTVIFSEFDVEATWDALYVFDGPDTSSPLISSGNPPTNSGFPAGGWYGTTIPGPFASTHPTGALTFRFLSDSSVTRPGWVADVVCLPVPPPNDLIQNAISVTNEPQAYTDPAVRLQYATNELLNPEGCAIAGTNGVWYSFTASIDGTAEASITTPAGTSAVIFYESPNENVGDETDLTFNFESSNQCAPGVASSITTTAGQSYYIFVLNTGGPSDVVIDISGSLSTIDNVIDGFVMYPNPATNVLNLNSNISIDTVEVYNMLGQKVLSQSIDATSTQLDVRGLSIGNYLIRVTAEGQTATYQFIKK